MSPSETQALHDDGYAKGKAGNPKDFCSHDILYSPAKYALWYRGWKKGRIDAGHERNPVYIWFTLIVLIVGAVAYYLSNSPQTEPSLVETTQPTETIEPSLDIDEAMILEPPSNDAPIEIEIETEIESKIETESKTETKLEPVESSLINRAFFTSGIENREPIDRLTEQTPHRKQLYFFSDFRGATGQTLYHEWHYERELMGKVEFKIKGPRWRVYSRKNILPEWSGFWTVLIRDEQGKVLHQQRIEVQP